MNLAELWTQVPTMTDAELKQLCCAFPSKDTATLLFGQQAMGSQPFQIAVTPMPDGTFFLLADVLREMHPEVTDTNLYGPDFAPLMEQLGPTVAVKPVTEAVLPAPPTGWSEETPPEWVQPTGAHDAYSVGSLVSHEGYTYRNLLDFNVFPPSPQSTLWEIYPDPGPLPWVQPTGATDAYDIGDLVTHTVAGRDETLWKSNIPANTTEPGTDGTFDRWWAPLTEVPPQGPQPWKQPIPGAVPSYYPPTQVTHNGKTWECIYPGCVWRPGDPNTEFAWREVV